MRCECITDFSMVEHLAQEWRRWATTAGSPNIFQSWGWARAYWRAYEKQVSLCTLVVRDADRVRGILPLIKDARGKLRFLGSPESDSNDLLCAPGDAPAVLEAALPVLLEFPGWNSGSLENLPADSRLAAGMAALPWRFRKHLQLVYRCPSPAIQLDQGGSELLKKYIKKERHKASNRRLRSRGRVNFRYIENREEIQQHLERFFEQHIQRWALAGIQSQFLQPERQAFFHALAEELDPRDEFKLAVLELNDFPIAYHWIFQLNGKMISYKPTFDVDFWDCGPGDALLHLLFEDAQKFSLDEFDFSVGDEAYKFRFANCTRPNYTLYLQRHPFRFTNLCNRALHRAAHTIRQNRRLKTKIAETISEAQANLNRAQTGLRGFTPDALRRRLLWSSGTACFYVSAAGAPTAGNAAPNPRLTFSGLAALSLQLPAFLTPARAREAQVRLKRGDPAFAIRQEETCAILWFGKRDRVELRQISPNCTFDVRNADFVLYDSWSNVSGGFFTAAALREITDEMAGNQIGIFCLLDDTAARDALESAGFQLDHAVRFKSIAGCFRRTRMTSFPAPGLAARDVGRATLEC